MGDIISNLLKAIFNIIENDIFDFNQLYPPKSEISNKNKINAVGDALEFFIKDSFSNSFKEINKEEIYKKYFSYIGNDSNPPDIVLKKGDAIEVKKIGGYKSQLQLNSSFPIQKLSSNNKLITEKCKNCENGKTYEKDMLYVIGVVKQKVIKSLFFVYGDCFAESYEFYQNKKDLIKKLLNDSSLNMKSSETNELSRFNSIDPLGVTSLRIRGMWLLDNPLKIFENYINFRINKYECSIFAIMRKNKFDSFPSEDKKNILINNKIKYNNIKIKNPMNPDELMDSILIRYNKL